MEVFKLKQVNIRLPEELISDIQEQAKKESRTVSNFIRKILEDYISNTKGDSQ